MHSKCFRGIGRRISRSFSWVYCRRKSRRFCGSKSRAHCWSFCRSHCWGRSWFESGRKRRRQRRRVSRIYRWSKRRLPFCVFESKVSLMKRSKRRRRIFFTLLTLLVGESVGASVGYNVGDKVGEIVLDLHQSSNEVRNYTLNNKRTFAEGQIYSRLRHSWRKCRIKRW